MVFSADVISDIHANVWNLKESQLGSFFSANSPNLILAGDIGDPDEPTLYKILDKARRMYKRIIYIPGNHEFNPYESNSRKTPSAVLDWFEKLDLQWDNFHFFYRRTEVFDGTRIIGATGWTTAPRDTAWAQTISLEGRKDRDFLDQVISKSIQPTIVVTHYVPTFRVLMPTFDLTRRLDYAQDLETLFRPPVKLWICGHIHQPHTLKINLESSMYGSESMMLVCNPYGYPHEGVISAATRKITVA